MRARAESPIRTLTCAGCCETVELTTPPGSLPRGWVRLTDAARFPSAVYTYRCQACAAATRAQGGSE